MGVTITQQESNMSVELNDLKPGQVILDVQGNIFVVVGILLNRPVKPVEIVKKAGGTTYVGPVSMISAIVGTVDLEKFKAPAAAFVPAFRPPMFGDGALPPEVQAMNLKPGDMITVTHGRKQVHVKFMGFHFNRPKYPVDYELNGKPWKGKFNIIVRKVS
jgi:hypothetical protein